MEPPKRWKRTSRAVIAALESRTPLLPGVKYGFLAAGQLFCLVIQQRFSEVD